MLVTISCYAHAQNKEKCDCAIVLAEIINDTELRYPGFTSKTQQYQVSYKHLKEQVIAEAKNSPDREHCFYSIEKYLAFFNDNHILFTDKQSEPKSIFRPDIAIYTERHPDSLTGIWKKKNDSLTIKIIREDKNGQQVYRAYILQDAVKGFLPGANYFDLIGNKKAFRIRRHQRALSNHLLWGRRLQNLIIEPEGIWQKVSSAAEPVTAIKAKYAFNNTFTYELREDSICYIGIPSFDIDPLKFDSLIVHQVIPELREAKTTHLIIDLRNNGCGNSSILSLLRISYDKPFSVPGDFVYATPAMVERYQHSDNPVQKNMLPKLLTHLGGFVQRDTQNYTLRQVCTYPKKISVIINENCASSTEYFLILARYSDRVKIYGRHTSGTLDYSELLGPEKLSREGYAYMRPTTKSFWTDTKPIDNKGLFPDVDLSSYPEYEWVERVIKN